VLLDSNILIYSAQPENAQLRELIAEYAPAVSALSYLEVYRVGACRVGVVNRFDVFLVNLDPTIGSEIQKTKPCVVISPDEMNKYELYNTSGYLQHFISTRL
jgi:hypothetical protein